MRSVTSLVVSLLCVLFGSTYAGLSRADALTPVDVSGTLASNTTWTSGNVYVVQGSVIIPDGVTLTIDAGAVVKYSTGLDIGIHVTSGGTLNAAGTAANPIVFTSLNDDSVAGDTAGDGPTTPSVGDYSVGIDMEGGTANVSHAQFAYADTALSGAGTSTTTISVVDSSFSNANAGIDLEGGSEAVILQRNHFNLTGTNDAVYVKNDSDLSGITLAGSDENVFHGSGKASAVVVNSSAVPVGATLTVDASSGAALWGVGNSTNIAGTLSLDSNTTLVTRSSSPVFVVGGTVNIQSGVTVKNSGTSDIGIHVTSGGTLNAAGTAANPIVFTSLNDDSVAGDTAGDGPTTPSVGDYSVGIDMEGGTANVSHAQFAYADTALDTSGSSNDVKLTASDINNVNYGLYITGSATMTFRGNLSSIAKKAIFSCNWGTNNCSVDAAYTDWGTAVGPFASNPTNDMVCGTVTVAPWTHSGSTYSNTNLTQVPNCDGSTTPDVQATTAATSFSSALGNDNIQCNDGYQDFCDAARTALACLNGALSVASSQSPFPLPGDSAGSQASTYTGDLLTGASTYVTSQESETIVGDGLSFASDLLGAVNTILSISNAYNSCA